MLTLILKYIFKQVSELSIPYHNYHMHTVLPKIYVATEATETITLVISSSCLDLQIVDLQNDYILSYKFRLANFYFLFLGWNQLRVHVLKKIVPKHYKAFINPLSFKAMKNFASGLKENGYLITR